ncbi:methionine synthase (B12-independent) [Antricoccus suffuscus]|uniref:5-methyltetrahydropteroyltriglutamate--homocysteine methyltransferase n=1 Tax=Antricoccus suffuscus TaxID=1629062 RepID=A0A2T0ZVY2_9ACTN|nr:5-methyltetrahydropteroyltriglutamate--homocysteine S-methyltransferase [Antricoccus suffuscus]PRZ40483.1 methionine synthase (B12-independent) [Antricoccus suffuscus]
MTDQATSQPPISQSTVYGYPRQGEDRELKRAVEGYWAGGTAEDLQSVARHLRQQRLTVLRNAGIDEVPVNDFSLYDHVLDMAVMLGAIPERHRQAVPVTDTPTSKLDRYFAMARGTADVAPMEMTKWFDTNYHYLVPELRESTEFELDASKPLEELAEARELGLRARPVILGPISFLLLSKAASGARQGFEPLSLVDRLAPKYGELLQLLHDAGAGWVQLDEPVLVTDQSPQVLAQVRDVYAALAAEQARPKIVVASYFERLGDALDVLAKSPVEGLAIDFTGPAAQNLTDLAAIGGIPGKRLIAGVIDGRNVWLADLQTALSALVTLLALADRVDVSASCSLLHVPLDVRLEPDLDPQVAAWLSFARQKLDEIVTLTRGVSGKAAIAEELESNGALRVIRSTSPLVRDEAVRARATAVGADDLRRHSPYAQRAEQQRRRLGLPTLPTTTIGSYPQTADIRKARAGLRKGTVTPEQYAETMREEIRKVIGLQEEIGLDVLVHGEPERNDMVQYFAEQLNGYVATVNGWVQSYGSRYVRPPIILGDVSRRQPMTVEWGKYAQSLTSRPVKGMLTGPVTMLAWSFVRDDQPQSETARQVGLALREEVLDLESAGIGVIQVDEPALRETLPLRKESRPSYLRWAVDSFLLATAGVRDQTQIHTHMCYADFEDILGAIVELDADVISLEAARSQMEIVDELASAQYPNEVGPGVWDIHSPRVPSAAELTERLASAVAKFPSDRLWANPDCGLKTRGYGEVRETLANLVAAAQKVRAGGQ